MTQERIAASALAGWISNEAQAADRFLFGLAGAPGSGKSTIAAQLQRALECVVVPMDGFHLPNAVLDERGLRDVKGAPETFDADTFVSAVRCLRTPLHAVHLPDFDRESDEPRPDRVTVEPDTAIVVVEGNYLLLEESPWSELADVFDAIAHIDIDRQTRFDRLVDRHVRYGKQRAAAIDFVRSSDEPNARRVEAVRARARLLVAADR